jgi:peroxiredoxin Q/BCP
MSNTPATIPDIDVNLTNDTTVNLTQYKGKPLIIFFYPRANTPGCTQEGKDFRDAIEQFNKKGIVILGASRDKIKAQSNFKNKHEFPFELISDPEEALCNAFDVIKEKTLYGKKSMGIERSTFIFDKNGDLFKEWRKVKVKIHIEEVLEAIKDL